MYSTPVDPRLPGVFPPSIYPFPKIPAKAAISIAISQRSRFLLCERTSPPTQPHVPPSPFEPLFPPLPLPPQVLSHLLRCLRQTIRVRRA